MNSSARVDAPHARGPTRDGFFVLLRDSFKGQSGSPVSRGGLQKILDRFHTRGVPLTVDAAERLFEGGTLQGLIVKTRGSVFSDGHCHMPEWEGKNGEVVLALSFSKHTSRGFMEGVLRLSAEENGSGFAMSRKSATLAVYPPLANEAITLFASSTRREPFHQVLVSSPIRTTTCMVAAPEDFVVLVQGRLRSQDVHM